MAQYNDLLRYVFQVTSQALSSVGWKAHEIMRAKFPTFQKSTVWGWFDQENLVSQVVVYPLQVRIFGTTYALGGLTGVGTYPEYSNAGLMHALLLKALESMRENGQFISYLFPYSIAYYRRKGWELVSNKMTYRIKDHQLPKNKAVPGFVRRVRIDSTQLKDAYMRFALNTHGAILRDDLAWNEYWLWDSEDMLAAVYANEHNQLNGFLVYSIAQNILHIKEMGFLNEEARHALWNFVHAHFSMIECVCGTTFTDESLAFLLEDASIKEEITPYYMARIVDFPEFIARYPFKADSVGRQWVFNLSDPLLECNNGTFCLQISENGKACAYKIQANTQDSTDIQTLTTMLMGYKRPEYLARIGRLRTCERVIDMLEDAIEQQTPYISDYF